MKKLLVVLFGVMLVLGACGGNDEGESTPVANNNTEEGDNATEDGTSDVANGEEVYAANCAACHGGDLGGNNSDIPAIAGISKEDVLATIEEGPGTMPPNLVSGQEAEDVAVYVANQ